MRTDVKPLDLFFWCLFDVNKRKRRQKPAMELKSKQRLCRFDVIPCIHSIGSKNSILSSDNAQTVLFIDFFEKLWWISSRIYVISLYLLDILIHLRTIIVFCFCFFTNKVIFLVISTHLGFPSVAGCSEMDTYLYNWLKLSVDIHFQLYGKISSDFTHDTISLVSTIVIR